MPEIGDRWEHGSELHRLEGGPEPATQHAPWVSGLLLGSGRDALRAVVRHGRAARGWRRLWIPAYLCQEVVGAIADEGLPLAVYADLPAEPLVLPKALPGDVVLVVNTFGLRTGPSPQVPVGVELLEDHTHDPWSEWAFQSQAAFAVASLRKTLPVPEGGVLWSPSGQGLPVAPEVSAVRARAARAKREAMDLKARFLAGAAVDKEEFRQLAIAGEAKIAEGEVSAMTAETRALLPTFPWSAWRERRRRNFRWLAERLARHAWLRVLRPLSEECVPFSVVIVVDTAELRERVRAKLIERRVYPAVLWPLEASVLPVPPEAIDLSRRVLSLHCDMRYGEEDLRRVAAIVEEAGQA